jgi:hypothetical protein
MDDDDNIIPYETTPSLTIKQAVMYMLGYRGKYNFMADTEPMDFDLYEYLYELQEEADVAFNNASVELEMLKRNGNASPEAIMDAEEKVASTKVELEKANKLPKIAERYRLLINHEFSRARLGKRNSLVIDEDESARAGQPCIITASFQEWLEGIELDDANEDSVPVRLPLVDDALDRKMELTKATAESLHVTLGLLVSLFAESSGGEFGSGLKPNVSGISKEIAKYALERKGGSKFRGQSNERIKDRIEVALSALYTTI